MNSVPWPNPWIPSRRGIFKMWLDKGEMQVLFGGFRTVTDGSFFG